MSFMQRRRPPDPAETKRIVERAKYGVPYRQLARMHRIDVGTIKKMVSRAKKAIKA